MIVSLSFLCHRHLPDCRHRRRCSKMMMIYGLCHYLFFATITTTFIVVYGREEDPMMVSLSSSSSSQQSPPQPYEESPEAFLLMTAATTTTMNENNHHHMLPLLLDSSTTTTGHQVSTILKDRFLQGANGSLGMIIDGTTSDIFYTLLSDPSQKDVMDMITNGVSGPYTIFNPDDNAFNETLGPDPVTDFGSWTLHIENLLLNHIISKTKLFLTSPLVTGNYTMANNATIIVNTTGSNETSLMATITFSNTSGASSFDMNEANSNITIADDGIIYDTSSLILPTWYFNDIARLCFDHVVDASIMGQLLNFGLGSVRGFLEGNYGISPPYTVFAVTMIGLTWYGTDKLNYLQEFEHKDELISFLLPHIYVGYLTWDMLLNMTNITMVSGDTFPIYVETNVAPDHNKPYIKIGNSGIINSETNILANDGLVHLIEYVLTLNDTNATAMPTTTTNYPTKAPTKYEPPTTRAPINPSGAATNYHHIWYTVIVMIVITVPTMSLVW